MVGTGCRVNEWSVSVSVAVLLPGQGTLRYRLQSFSAAFLLVFQRT